MNKPFGALKQKILAVYGHVNNRGKIEGQLETYPQVENEPEPEKKCPGLSTFFEQLFH